MNNKIPYGIIIKNIRNRCGLTQETLADKIGIDRTTISAYERETKKPSIEMFYKICSLCDTDMCFKIKSKIYTINELKRGF